MGKAQSKRSVDITTESKKDCIAEEGTGKLEKIEDADQLKPQINGDTNHSENEATEKAAAENEGTENEKDLSTEKEQSGMVSAEATSPTVESPSTDVGASGDTVPATTPTTEGAAADVGDKTEAATADSNAIAESDSSKKSKKEKVKKKWSFRSISFGKKDKQKPPKKEEGTGANASGTATTATNGECEKVPEETTEDPAANGNDTTIDENIEKTSETKSEENKSDDADQIKSNAEETPITEEAEEMKPTVAIAESETLVTNGVGSSTEKVTPPAEAKEDIIPSVRSENVLEQQSAIEEAKVPEPIAVAETETPTVATNGSVELIENNGTVEVAKVLNGTTAESPKIEVKTENDENINNSVTSNKDTTATASEVVVPLVEPTTADDGGDVSKDVVEQQQQKQEPQQQQTEQIIATSDSDINSGAVIVEPIAQSSPPPPLPCSPPPSQVMVFALSDEESQVANSQTNQAPSESPVAAAATEAEISADAKLPATVDVEKPENDQPIELVEDHSPVAETKSSLEAEKESTGPLEASDAQANEQLVQSTQGKDVEEKEDKDAKENTEDDMSHGKGFPPTPVQFSSDNVEYSEAFLGVPDVDVITAQTIALIDEVTQEAATEVEKIIMIDESLGQPSPSLEERTLDDEKATQCNPPPTAELESQTSFSSTQLNSEQSENIPPPAADVVVPTTDTSPDSKVDQVEIEQKQIETSQHIDQLQDNTVTSLTEAPLEDNSNKPIDTTTIPETTTNDKLETPPSSSEIKENGIGDAHDQPIETSATESLNGSVEHKTIEEMKADHQIEKAPNDIVTQEAAVAVE